MPSGGATPQGRGGLLRYAAGWLLGGAIVATAIVLLLRSAEDEPRSLPPVRETRLERAAQRAGCELRRARGRMRLNPPVVGARVRPALRPGVYRRAEDPRSVVAAMRAGTIVVQYRPSLPRTGVGDLERLHGILPNGTIVVPNRTRMRYELAATAWRRLLGCPRYTPKAIDAIRLFRGRYVGRGPDRP